MNGLAPIVSPSVSSVVLCGYPSISLLSTPSPPPPSPLPPLPPTNAQVEAELSELSEADRKEYLESLGVEEGGLGSLVRAAYRLLGLRTYFTSGEKVRWKAQE